MHVWISRGELEDFKSILRPATTYCGGIGDLARRTLQFTEQHEIELAELDAVEDVHRSPHCPRVCP
jgi:hypothetical protein